MCVTNIAKRNARLAAAVNRSMVANTPSLISQRLLGNFMPLMMNNQALPKNSGTVSTCTTLETVPTQPQVMVPASLNYLGHPAIPVGVPAKKRPRRRRKPQKPGKTAKQNDRHFVVHNYHDHASDPDETDVVEDNSTSSRRRGGASLSFPTKLHGILDQVETDGLGHIISWQPHGRAFVIHRPKDFVDHVMPKYFRQTKLTSFQRQLNLYGFCRLTRGGDSGGYYHELFLRGKVSLAKRMQRTKIKGTKFKAASSPDQEPDFYSMSPVIVTPSHTSDESSADGNACMNITRRKPTARNAFLSGDMGSMVSFEPLPFQDPIQPNVASFEPYPMISPQPTLVPNGTTFNNAVGKANDADDVLDAVVDEIFSNDPLMDDTQDLEDIWDGSGFEEGVQNDIQLGLMLEKLLQA